MKLVSIVVATFQRPQLLEQFLNACCSLHIPDSLQWEILVVDNSSNESARPIVGKFANTLPVQFFTEKKLGVSHARNRGIQNAEGEYVIFTDDDVIPSPQWISAYYECFQETKLSSFFGGPVSISGATLPLSLKQNGYVPLSIRGVYWGDKNISLSPSMSIIGPNWAAPRNILLKIGGFNPSFGTCLNTAIGISGEETDLMERLQLEGYKGYYVANAHVTHRINTKKVGDQWLKNRIHAYVTSHVVRHPPSHPYVFWMQTLCRRVYGILWLAWSLCLKRDVWSPRVYCWYHTAQMKAVFLNVID